MPRTELPDFVGRQIGTFFVLSKLGQGSFGAVYKVKLDNARGRSSDRSNSSSSGSSALTTTMSIEEERDSDIHAHLTTRSAVARHRTYALKITSQKTYESTRRALGEYEHILHARCSGARGVLPLYASFPVEYEGGKYFCLVLEYVEGGSLLDLISTEGALYRNDALVRGIFAQVVGAVRGCHERGVYHRDLKPENVLVSKDYKVYIADFGLATNKRRSRHFSTGSKPYISPECARILVPLDSELDNENNPGPRTLLKDCHVPDGAKDSYDTALNDVWSLGIILFNMVAGGPPWSRADPDSNSFLLSYRHAGQFLRGRYPLSSALDALLMRILELRPQQRIGLYELECTVKEMGTFYMSKEELASSRFEVARKCDEMYERRREMYLVKRDLELLGFAPSYNGRKPVVDVRGEVKNLPAAAGGVACRERERNPRKQRQEPVRAAAAPLPQRPRGTATRIMAAARKHIRAPFTAKNKLSNSNNDKNAHNKKAESRGRSNWNKALPRRPVLSSSTWSTSFEVDMSAPKTPTVEESCGVVSEPRIAAEGLAELARGFLGDVDGGDTAAKARAASARVVLMVPAPAEGAVAATAAAAAASELAAQEEARGFIKTPSMAYYARGKSRSKAMVTHMQNCRRLGIADNNNDDIGREWITASSLLARV